MIRSVDYLARTVLVVGVALVTVSLGTNAVAAGRTWANSPGDDDWYNSANWVPVGYPAPSDHLAVYLGSPQTKSNVYTDSGGSITISGFDASALLGRLYVGNTGSGTLKILNSGEVANTYGYIGYGSGSDGMVTVDDASTWTNSQSLYIAGGMSSAGGSGLLTVSGGDSGWAMVYVANRLKLWNSATVNLDYHGLITADTLEVAKGGKLNMNTLSTLRVNALTGPGLSRSFDGTLQIGHAGGSGSGSHTVGAGQGLEVANALDIGYDAVGSLSVHHGGEVSSPWGFIGKRPGSEGTVTVDGSGSTWTSSVMLDVGFRGTGSLTISHGGTVTSAEADIGSSEGSEGTAIVTGSGSTWISSGSLHVGGSSLSHGGTGTLTVADGGAVSVGQTLRVWETGTLELLGSAINTGSFLVHPDGTFTHHHGTLTVDVGTFDPGTSGPVIDGAADGDLPTVVLTAGATGSFTGDLTVGRDRAGALEVRSGSQFSNSIGYVGDQSGSHGTVTVDGTGSVWTNSGSLMVGWRGNGELSISGGGSVSDDWSYVGCFSGSEGVVTVDGPGSAWTHSLNINVGRYGTGTLTVSNGATVSNTFAAIGAYPGSHGTVLVEGTDSTWTCSGSYVYVGGIAPSAGGTAELTVADGGRVDVSDGTLKVWGTATVSLNDAGLLVADAVELISGAAFNAATGSTLRVNTLTGFGNHSAFGGFLQLGHASGSGSGSYSVAAGQSLQVGQRLTVGHNAAGNLTIQNGGTVSSGYAYVGHQGGSEGSVTVDGAGSAWANSGLLYVGVSGGASLSISDGGTVSNSLGCIAYTATSLAGVTVTGSGSTWTNSGSLYVGGSASSAGGTGSLTVAGGGLLNVGQTLKVWDTGAVELSGSQINTGSFLVEPGGAFTHTDGTLTVDGGTFDPGTSDLTVDGAANGDLPTVKLINSAAASFTGHLRIGRYNSAGLEIRSGSRVDNAGAYVGSLDGASGTVTVDGPDSSWANSEYVYVGLRGAGSLTISAGGQVSSTSAQMGFFAGAEGTVIVDGPDSTWTGGLQLDVGRDGTGSLTISKGGRVSIEGLANIGTNEGAHGTVTLDGPGSALTNTGPLFVGGGGDPTAGTGVLVVRNGGAVANSAGYIASQTGGQGKVTVDGPDSIWKNSAYLEVGDTGNGSLTISNGGRVTNTFARVGLREGSEGRVVVEGSGSTWASSGSLEVARHGPGTLTITNGGCVSNTTGFISHTGEEDGNVTVTGAGSSWANSLALNVGTSGPVGAGIGSLTVDEGGAVSVGLTLGIWRSGTLRLLGGQVHTVSLVVDPAGTFEHDNGLLIVDGGICDPGKTDPVVEGGTAPGQLATVTLINGATASFSGNLTVGHDYAGAAEIRRGSDVSNAAGFIGWNPGSHGSLIVDGSGSTWSNSVHLGVALAGTGSLTISAGGAVYGPTGCIGEQIGSNGTVTVTDSGSTWANSDTLKIGYHGAGELTIRDGGTVSNTHAYIGCGGGSDATVTVDGSGATWSNTGDLYVGHEGTGTLNIRNQGSVSVGGTVTIGTQGTIDVGPGDAELAAPVLNHGTVNVRTGDTLTFSGEVGGAGSFTGPGTVVFQDKFSPGDSIATVSFGGDLKFGSAAALNVELDGPDQDRLAVAGSVHPDGMLSVQAIGGLEAVGESTRAIIQTAEEHSIPGDFAMKPSLGDYLEYGVFYRSDAKTASGYQVTVFQALQGDTNADGDVDPADLAKLAVNWDPAGTERTWPEGNFDDYRDGNVDPADLARLALNWSPAGYLPEGAPGLLGRSTAVPEPGTLLLLAGGGIGFVLLWRIRKVAQKESRL